MPLTPRKYRQRSGIHGHSRQDGRSGTYSTWAAMLQRCTNPHAARYDRYGGRGITVCDRWKEFTNFLADMGERPFGCSIDRINNDGPYEPSNCRWATTTEQSQNTSRATWIEFNGRRQLLTAWASELDLHYTTLSGRLRRGWPLERALSPAHARSRWEVKKTEVLFPKLGKSYVAKCPQSAALPPSPAHSTEERAL